MYFPDYYSQQLNDIIALLQSIETLLTNIFAFMSDKFDYILYAIYALVLISLLKFIFGGK